MKSWVILITILAVALLVRVVGAKPGHNYYHPDEPMSYGSATDMFVFGDLNPRRFDYPSGVPLIHYGVYKTFTLPVVFAKILLPHPRMILTALTLGQRFFSEFRVQIFGPRDLNALYWSRYTNAVMGVLAVFFTYLIAEKLVHSIAGLVAASVVAVNYRHVLSSHLALSDIPNSFFALVAFYFSLLLLQKNSTRRYTLASIAVLLSISMKYQVLALAPFLTVHLLWVRKSLHIRQLINKKIVVSGLIVAVGFLLMNPYLPFNWEKTQDILRVVYLRYGAGANRFNVYPLYYLYYWGIGQWTSIAIVVGLLLSLFRYPLQSFFLLTYVAPFMYIFLYYMTGGTYVRNFTTVIPFLSIFVGFGAYVIHQKLVRYIKPLGAGLLVSGVVVMMSLSPARDSFVLSQAYAKPWSRELLTQWVQKNIPDNATIINDNTSIPSDPNKPLNLIAWSRDHPNSVTELMKQNIDFAVINTDWNQAYFYWFDMPLTKLSQYRGIPYPILKDTYHGLLMSEYHNYAVYGVYRPRQAPDDAYLVVKVPKYPQTVGRMIWSNDFTKNTNGWEFYDFNDQKQNGDLKWNSVEGYNGIGSLEVTGSLEVISRTRIISPFIPVTPGNTYTIEGYIRTDEKRANTQKDGFFQVNFYQSDDTKLLGQQDNFTALSEASYGEPGWKKKQIIVSASPGSHYLTIQFGRTSPGTSRHYFIDNIRVYESKEPLGERFSNIPYTNIKIPDDLIYPNSIY